MEKLLITQENTKDIFDRILAIGLTSMKSYELKEGIVSEFLDEFKIPNPPTLYCINGSFAIEIIAVTSNGKHAKFINLIDAAIEIDSTSLIIYNHVFYNKRLMDTKYVFVKEND